MRCTVRHVPRLVLGLLASLALFAAACGNSDDDDASPTTEASEDTAAPDDTGDGTDTSEFVPIEGVPGVSDDEISYASFGTFAQSNPLGTCTMECMVHGIEAYFAYRNSEGGIWGRELVVEPPVDDELTKNQEKALEIVSAGDAFGAFSATQVASGWQDITAAGMPLYVWNIHPIETQDEAVFGNAPVICQRCLSRVASYIAETEGVTKVGVLGYGISENSKIAAQNFRDSLDAAGIQTVYFNDNLDFGLPNGIAPEVTEMKNAGVEMVASSIDLNGQKTLAQEMERQGLGDVPFYHPNTYNQDFVAEAGDLFVGDYVGVGFRPFEAEAEGTGLATYFEWMDELGYEIDEISTVGWIVADAAYQGLVKAGPNFDQQKVIDATNTITDFTADGLIPPIDWSQQHVPASPEDPGSTGQTQTCTALVRVTEDAEFEVVGDPEAPWLCWPVDDPTVVEPEFVDFE